MCESTATEESYAQSTFSGFNREIKGVHKVLGIMWDVDTDELIINVEPIVSEVLDENLLNAILLALSARSMTLLD